MIGGELWPMLINYRSTFLCLALFCILAPTVSAAVVVNFAGLRDLEPVFGFYTGSFGGLGSGPGPNSGILFSPGFLVLRERQAGGGGFFVNEPSPTSVLFPNPGDLWINVPGGFTGSFAFSYSASVPGVIRIFDQPNGGGNLLASIATTRQFDGNNCSGDVYCNWTAASATFAGVARSVDFSGGLFGALYDDLTFGEAASQVPEPSSVILTSAGLLLFAAARSKRGW